MNPALHLPQPMQALRRLQRRFDRRQLRERRLMLVAAAVAALAVGDLLFIEPALQAWKLSSQRVDGARAALDVLRNDLVRQARDQQVQSQQLRAEVGSWRQRLRGGEEALRSYEAALVGPDQMVALLEQLLSRHGDLRVRQLRTLPRVDLLAGAAAGAAGAASAAGTGATGASTNANRAAAAASQPAAAAAAPAAAAAGAAGPGSLYRHGVELTLEGHYPGLVAYLQALEAQPRRLLWGGLTLKVEQHPTTVMTLRLYTISRDSHWLEI